MQLALFEELAPAMNPQAVQDGMKAMFAGSGPRLAMLSPAPVTGLGQALAAAEAAAPAARRAERSVSMDELPPLGGPGREVSRQRIADLDTTIVRFANGSSLVFKQTDYEKGNVNVALRFGSGMSGLPADRKSLAWMAPLLGSTGVGPLDLDGLERLLTGRRLSMSFDMDEDSAGPARLHPGRGARRPAAPARDQGRRPAFRPGPVPALQDRGAGELRPRFLLRLVADGAGVRGRRARRRPALAAVRAGRDRSESATRISSPS